MLDACKKCRREGEKLMLKGERCFSPKCAMIKRPYAPGQQGQTFHGKSSEYGKQLREKQKARRIYGLSESQFSLYARKADKMAGNSALNLLRMLELRLDNAIYRLGLARSRSEARQAVSHRAFTVNGKRVSIPSFQLREKDVVLPVFKERYTDRKVAAFPSWLSFDAKTLQGTVVHKPEREEIDTTLNESLIIEFYSR